jgi:hypothetical protein
MDGKCSSGVPVAVQLLGRNVPANWQASTSWAAAHWRVGVDVSSVRRKQRGRWGPQCLLLCVPLQGTIAGNWSPYDRQSDRRGIAGVVGPAYGNIVA